MGAIHCASNWKIMKLENSEEKKKKNTPEKFQVNKMSSQRRESGMVLPIWNGSFLGKSL